MELLRLGLKPVLGLSLNTHAAGWKGEKRHRTERYLWYLHLSKVKYLDFCFGIALVGRSYKTSLGVKAFLNKVSPKPVGSEL